MRDGGRKGLTPPRPRGENAGRRIGLGLTSPDDPPRDAFGVRPTRGKYGTPVEPTIGDSFKSSWSSSICTVDALEKVLAWRIEDAAPNARGVTGERTSSSLFNWSNLAIVSLARAKFSSRTTMGRPRADWKKGIDAGGSAAAPSEAELCDEASSGSVSTESRPCDSTARGVVCTRL